LATHPSSWVAAATATAIGTGATTVALPAHASIIIQTTQLLSETPIIIPVEIKPNPLLLLLLDLLGCNYPWDPWVFQLIIGTGLVGFFFLGWGISGSFLTTKSFPPKATTETELLQSRLTQGMTFLAVGYVILSCHSIHWSYCWHHGEG
jgi:hypothetical protein